MCFFFCIIFIYIDINDFVVRSFVYNTALFTIYNKLYKNAGSCDFGCHLWDTRDDFWKFVEFLQPGWILNYTIKNINMVPIL